jgi:nicotinamidase-related amidase
MVVDSVSGFFPVYNAAEVTANAVAVRAACYEAGIPVVQLQHRHRADGLNTAPNEPRSPDGRTPAACVPGTPGFSIVPELDPGDRDIVVNKHRWHGFFGTELLAVLHSLRAEQLIWIGGFTDACLGLSVFEGYFHDYPSALIADASTCDNEFTHKTAVLTLANWVYDLTIFTTPNFVAWLSGEDAPRWYSGTHNACAFHSGDEVEALYASVIEGQLTRPTPAAVVA